MIPGSGPKAVLQARSRKHPRCIVFGAVLTMLIVGLAPSVAQAQRFGQWWWTATAAAKGNRVQTSSASRADTEFGSDHLSLALGLRGYIVHPAIGEFSLDVNAAVSQVEGGRNVDTDRSGFRADVKLLPYSYTPISFYVSRSVFDYSDLSDESGFTLRSFPDTTFTWGGLIRSQWDGLRGLRFRFLSREVDFLDPEAGTDAREEQTLFWSRGIHQIQNSLKLSRRYWQYGFADFAAEDLILSLEQRGPIAPRWRWDQTLGGTRREAMQTASTSATEHFSLFSRFTGSRQSGDQMLFALSAGTAESNDQQTKSLTLSSEYTWDRGGRWRITPSVDYALIELDDTKITSPQVGLAVAWQWEREATSVAIFNRAGYRLLKPRGTDIMVPESTALTYNARLSVAAGAPSRLRHRYELSLGRNELDFIAPADPDRIDFAIVVNQDLLSDILAGRVTLERSWGKLRATSNTNWTRRESAFRDNQPNRVPIRRDQGFVSEALSQVVQISRHPFDLSASLGTSDLIGQGSSKQTSDLLTGSVRWRVRRPLGLHARYRSEKRATALLPAFDFERFEAGVEFSLGLLSFEADIFESRDRTAGGAGRASSGFRWRITRRAFGLLPIVSAPERNGFIR